MAWLSAPLASRWRPLPILRRVRRVGRRRAGGVGGVLAKPGFQIADALLQRGDFGLECGALRLQGENEELNRGGQRFPGVRGSGGVAASMPPLYPVVMGQSP
jgi:hypothetical protein